MTTPNKEQFKAIHRFAVAPISVTAISLFYIGAAIGCSTSMHPQAGQAQNSASSNMSMAAAVNTAKVTIKGFQFMPANIRLKKGGKVTFTNKDSTPHTVTPNRGAKFTGTGRLAAGASKTVVFKTVGVQSYHCAIHPSMMGKVTVVR